MIATIFPKSKLTHFLTILFEIDVELSESMQSRSCPFCGGPLHRASYRRQGDGGSISIPADLCIRLSLCCGRDGCRRRVLPPSCLFWGRRVYLACIILIAVSLQQNSTKTAAQVEALLGVPVRTLRRWMSWFRNEYLRSRQWLIRQGFIVSPLGSVRAVGVLFDRFMSWAVDPLDGLVHFVRFMTVDPLVWSRFRRSF